MSDRPLAGARDALMRVNFLQQAAMWTVQQAQAPPLAAALMNDMKTVVHKQVLRLDPNVKRMICKKCRSLLVPGDSSSTRTRGRREPHLVVRCGSCSAVKRFPTLRHRPTFNSQFPSAVYDPAAGEAKKQEQSGNQESKRKQKRDAGRKAKEESQASQTAPCPTAAPTATVDT